MLAERPFLGSFWIKKNEKCPHVNNVMVGEMFIRDSIEMEVNNEYKPTLYLLLGDEHVNLPLKDKEIYFGFFIKKLIGAHNALS